MLTDSLESDDKYPQKFQKLKRRLEQYAAEAVKPNIPPNRMPKDFKVPENWGHACKKRA